MRSVISGVPEELGGSVPNRRGGTDSAALDKAQESYYDLLIMDLRLPGFDVLTLTVAFAKVSPETKVIWMTAHGCCRFARASKGLCVYPCLDKPIEILEIQ